MDNLGLSRCNSLWELRFLRKGKLAVKFHASGVILNAVGLVVGLHNGSDHGQADVAAPP